MAPICNNDFFPFLSSWASVCGYGMGMNGKEIKEMNGCAGETPSHAKGKAVAYIFFLGAVGAFRN